MVCPWSTSHSLTQRALFNGKYFFTASLGDSEPHNIKIVRFDSNLSIHLCKYNQIENENNNDIKSNELEKIEEEKDEDKKEENEEKKEKDSLKLEDTIVLLYF